MMGLLVRIFLMLPSKTLRQLLHNVLNICYSPTAFRGRGPRRFPIREHHTKSQNVSPSEPDGSGYSAHESTSVNEGRPIFRVKSGGRCATTVFTKGTKWHGDHISI